MTTPPANSEKVGTNGLPHYTNWETVDFGAGLVANHDHGAVLRHIHTLFDVGVAGGLTDRHLLERFTTRNGESAEAAFALLVERHGPMVLGVCRAVLRDEDDAQDAFQATFLVLVRRAGSIRNRDSLGSWLCGVAQRVSSCARSARARRRAHERKRSEMTALTVGEWDMDDLGPVLHEEINRLPEAYRAPIVLCHLEGLTHEDAAHQLKWPVGTVKSRMARGRERLRSRLIRRGMKPSLGLMGEALRAERARASVSAALAEATVRAAMQYAADKAAAGSISASVVLLTEGALKAMVLTKLKMIASALLAVGAVATGAGVLAQRETTPVAIPKAAGAKGEPETTAAPAYSSPPREEVNPPEAAPTPPAKARPAAQSNRRSSVPPPAISSASSLVENVPVGTPLPSLSVIESPPAGLPPTKAQAEPPDPAVSLDAVRERALREANQALAGLDARAKGLRAELQKTEANLKKTEADLGRARALIQALEGDAGTPYLGSASSLGAIPSAIEPAGVASPEPAAVLEPVTPFSNPGNPGANPSDQERRLREMERKLDLLLKAFDETRSGNSPPPTLPPAK